MDYIEGFHIRYRVSSSKPDYSMVTVLNSGATSYTLTNLRKYTKYEVFLTPFYKSIDGQPSNVKVVQTLEDGKCSCSLRKTKVGKGNESDLCVFGAVPSAPPTNIQVGLLNLTSAFVRWTPPPQEEHNGLLVGYKVNR